MINLTLSLSFSGDSISFFSAPHLDDEVVEAQNPQDALFQTYVDQAATCKTHQAVLNFLNQMKTIKEQFPTVKELNTYHHNNPNYPDHVGFPLKKLTHECSLENMIQFVTSRIQGRERINSAFDSFESKLNGTIRYLKIGTIIPLFGIVPGALISICGLVQLVASLILTAKYAIPAYYEEDEGKLIVQRSIKHLVDGPVNVLAGIARGIPIYGTWVYFKTC